MLLVLGDVLYKVQRTMRSPAKILHSDRLKPCYGKPIPVAWMNRLSPDRMQDAGPDVMDMSTQTPKWRMMRRPTKLVARRPKLVNARRRKKPVRVPSAQGTFGGEEKRTGGRSSRVSKSPARLIESCE